MSHSNTRTLFHFADSQTTQIEYSNRRLVLAPRARRSDSPPTLEQLGPMRRCVSEPALAPQAAPADPAGLEVFVIKRHLNVLEGKLPPPVRNVVSLMGVSHYMTAFRTMDGRIVQFDFGPKGGRDIHVAAASPLARIVTPGQSSISWRSSRQTSGEIRETKLSKLPDAHMFVGRTRLTLADIRNFNALQQNLAYELHCNDCRHYVNSIVQYTTGVDGAAAALTRHNFLARRATAGPHWGDSAVLAAHLLTDVSNWPRIKAASQALVAVAATFMGRQTLTRLPRPLLPTAPAPGPILALGPVRTGAVRRYAGLAAASVQALAGGTGLSLQQGAVKQMHAAGLPERLGKAVVGLAGSMAGAIGAARRCVPVARLSTVCLQQVAAIACSASSAKLRDGGIAIGAGMGHLRPLLTVCRK